MASGQSPVSGDSPFQVRYAGNISVGDPVINISHTGATAGNICVNIYAFSPDEQLISCCSCTLTPNGLVSLPVRENVISNAAPITPSVPGSVMVKLLATTAAGCNPALPGDPVPGMVAWATTLHASAGSSGYSTTETAFTPASLSAFEFTRMTRMCGVIQANGSGYGICRSCRSGALGSVKK